MILKLIEAAQGITLSYPAWVPWLFAGGALGMIYILIWRAETRKGRRLAAAFGVLGLIWAALYFGTYRASFDADGASLYSFTRYNLKVDWRDVTGFRLERARNRGRVGHVMLIATEGSELEFNISDLDDDGLRLLTRYVEAQIAASRRPTDSR
jgi:hypothetical protein